LFVSSLQREEWNEAEMQYDMIEDQIISILKVEPLLMNKLVTLIVSSLPVKAVEVKTIVLDLIICGRVELMLDRRLRLLQQAPRFES
jgi:hypothetical protein